MLITHPILDCVVYLQNLDRKPFFKHAELTKFFSQNFNSLRTFAEISGLSHSEIISETQWLCKILVMQEFFQPQYQHLNTIDAKSIDLDQL